MAKPIEIIDGLKLLAAAGLDYAPRDITRLSDVWVRIFGDIPGAIFNQAITDYLRTETRWPAPAKIRAMAEKVKANNGRSTSGGQFVDPSRQRAPYAGIARIGEDGHWYAVYREELSGHERAADLPDDEPPPHPEFASWEEAQAWREAECTPW